MKQRRRAVLSACILLVAAFLMTALCSMSSPLYPINIWDDANCLLTVGRAMRTGKVLYRDIYEQKGPLLYFAHMLSACVSDTSFLGVYLLESLCVCGFLFLSARILRRRIGEAAVPLTILLTAGILTSGTFVRGDSAEEFCLPLTMAALWIFDSGARKNDFPFSRLFSLGLLAGLVATVKFTLLGIFLGLCLAVGLQALKTGGIPRATRCAGAFLCGMTLPILPWVLYFGVEGALGDFGRAYLYNNVFLYAGAVRMGLSDWAAFFRQSGLWALPCMIGLFFFLRDKKEPVVLRLGTGLSFFIQLLAVLLPGRVWQYSLLALSPFAIYCAIPAARLFRTAANRIFGKNSESPQIIFAGGRITAVMLSLVICVFVSPNAFLRGVPLKDTAQGRLAEKIPAGSSLLQYKFLDDGLYLASGAIPEEKYFVLLNVQLPQMREALDEAVTEGRPDYVLTSYDPLPPHFDRYTLIGKDLGYLDNNRPRKEFYLYRRKTVVTEAGI